MRARARATNAQPAAVASDQLGQRERDVAAERLHAQHERDHRQHREDQSEQVQLTDRAPGAPRLGEHDRRQCQQHHHHGHVDQEDRAPPGVLEQDPADHRSERRARREPGRPDGQGEAALGAVAEEGPQQRQRGGHQHRAEHAEQGAGRDEVRGLRRERGGRRHRTEAGDADQQQAAPAEPVAERAHRDQQPGQRERVDVDDPQQLGRARREGRADRGQREAQHRVVDGDEQRRQEQHDQPEPLATAGARGRGRARRGGSGHSDGRTSIFPSERVQSSTIPSGRYSCW